LAFTGGVTDLAISGNILVATSDNETVKMYELQVVQSQEDKSIFNFLKEKGEFKKFSKERALCVSSVKAKKLLIMLSKK
jgi:hypothetical protein